MMLIEGMLSADCAQANPAREEWWTNPLDDILPDVL
jgi:hypothetical protein